MKRFCDILSYVQLGSCVFASAIIGDFFVIAQIVYLIADSIAITRDFALKRPTSDKIRSITMTVLCIFTLVKYIIKNYC